MGNHYNCIYMYTNLINGKKYVGKAKDFNYRHKQHLEGNEQLIDKKINEYGIKNFKVEILIENVQDDDKLNEYEKFFIKRKRSHVSYGTGYNRTWGGDGGDVRSGMTEEQRREHERKLSESHKGEKNPTYGKHRSEETKQKLSEAMKGKMAGEKHPLYGKPKSEETKRKLSEAFKGKPLSEEHKQKLSESHKGKPHKPFSEEHKQRISEAKSKNVICLETLQIFDNARKAGEWCGVTSVAIRNNLRGHAKYSGKHPITGEKLHWMYYSDYLKLQEEENDR